MYYTPRRKWQLRIANAIFMLLFLTAVGLLQWLGREYSLRFDLTATHRHSLSAASIAAVERLRGPVAITAFASPKDDMRARIRGFIDTYQRHKPDIELHFVDPDESPDKARAAGVRHDGELIFSYAGATERLAPPTRLDEEAFTNTLTRLGHRTERWLVFLSGHGERHPDGRANFDFSAWAQELQKRGFKTRALSLAENPQVPMNTSVLVIAGPRVRLLPGEAREIQKYLEHGGNLLWLTDPGPLHGLEPLAEFLGIEFLRGTVVDPNSEKTTGYADAIAIANYGPHPVVRDLGNTITIFPRTGALQLNPPKGWQGAALLDTQPSAWLESGALTPPITFDKGKDLRGPLTIAAALTRTDDKQHEQRVAVLANGDFLSNAFLANAGNLDLGLSLINWLSRDDAYVSIPVRIAPDRRFDVSPYTKLALLGAYFGLPLSAAGIGIVVWWRRRKR